MESTIKRVLWIIVAVLFILIALSLKYGGRTQYTWERIQQSFSGKKADISIVMGGDVMFDRNIREQAQKGGYDLFFDEVRDFFMDADLTVVNLEGPITSNPSKTLLGDGFYSKDLIFTFATSTASALKKGGIDIASLANNHSDNFLFEGYKETLKWLDAAEVAHFGSAWNFAENEYVTEIDGVKIAFVGYHAFQQGFDRILIDIKRLSDQGCFVIVMPHWGEEYTKMHSPLMEEQANRMIEVGADAIIGAHPHVIMDHQWIGKVPVFYSLGNLLFDQYFNAGVKHGNVIRLNLDKAGFGLQIKSIEVFDVFNEKGKPIQFDEKVKVEEVI